MTRIGASQVFFNIVAQFNAEKLIKDYRSVNTVMKAVSSRHIRVYPQANRRFRTSHKHYHR